MPIYYYVIPGPAFHEQICPALSASWKERSFAPCRDLCAGLATACLGAPGCHFLQSAKPLLCQAAQALPFDRLYWSHLVGEILVYSAVRMPEVPLSPETLGELLAAAQEAEEGRYGGRLGSIEQAGYGSRDLIFGGKYYRPGQVGWNDHADVTRLAADLAAFDPRAWDLVKLRPRWERTSEAERDEELDFVREWFPALRELYQQAEAERDVVVCETL
jgi:hypothetical protein